MPAASGLNTAPPIARSSMKPRPWMGFTKGLMYAVLRSLPFMRDDEPVDANPPAWQFAAARRRATLISMIAVLTAAATGLLLRSAPALLESKVGMLQTLLFAVLFAWVSAGFVTALMGVYVMWRGERHALTLPDPNAPISPAARTAIIMPICNEDVASVFAGLRATCESLAATGALSLFDIYVLSDTSKPELQRAEVEAWNELRRVLGDADDHSLGSRIFYRWRRIRTRRKAGNVADFCRRWGRNYRYMVVFDADSVMSGDALVTLVRTMEAYPRAGIVQTLPQACGHDTLHARAQQFASKVTGRLFSLGMAYWQLGESHYWGHNAIIRIKPFMDHCGLAPLPGRGGLSGDILSHDFVEAALMRRAGYEVWLVPHVQGSWEQNPPNLLDELQRDRRWCQGNLQNARLIAEPGFKPVHRAMFATGAMSYLAAPLWVAFVLAGLLQFIRMGEDASPLLATPDTPPPLVMHGFLTGSVWAMTLVLLMVPRLLGVLAVWARGEHKSFGGMPRLLMGSLLELLLSALQAPVRMAAHTLFVLGALTGLRLEWKSPPRDASAVRWGDAAARVGLFAVPAVLMAAIAIKGEGAGALLWAPLLLPLLLAVPLAVATGSVAFGGALRQRGLLAIPEELAPPRPLVRSRVHGTTELGGTPALGPVLRTGVRWGPALASMALVMFALVPRHLTAPADPPVISMQVASKSALPETAVTPKIRKTGARAGQGPRRKTPLPS